MTPQQCIYEVTGCCFRQIWIHSLFRCLTCFCGARWQCASLSWGDVIREEIESKEQAWPTVQLLCCHPSGCREELAADTKLKWAENRPLSGIAVWWLESNDSYLLSVKESWKHQECQAPIFSAQSDATKEAEPLKVEYNKAVMCIFQDPAPFSSIILITFLLMTPLFYITHPLNLGGILCC